MKREVLNAVLIGSYRRDFNKLEETFKQLNKNYSVLYPNSIDFVNNNDSFVKTKDELDIPINAIEERVLDAMHQADFVWLFNPDGKIGLSASFEMGYAHSIGVPIFSNTPVTDAMLSTMITAIVPLTEVPHTIHRPGKAIQSLQGYYKKVSERRGWNLETPRDTMLLLVEEVGELARAIRKLERLRRDGDYTDTSIQDEIADVQLYLVHLANSLNIRLGDAVTDKETKNHLRFKKSSGQGERT